MAVEDMGPDPDKCQVVTCDACNHKLRYMPKDVWSKRLYFGDECAVTRYITCPSCEREIRVD